MSDQSWIVGVTDYDTADALGPAVCMEGVGYGLSVTVTLLYLCYHNEQTFLLYILSLAGFRSFGNGLGEKGHEIAIAGEVR